LKGVLPLSILVCEVVGYVGVVRGLWPNVLLNHNGESFGAISRFAKTITNFIRKDEKG